MDLGHIVLRDLRYVVLFVEDLERSLRFYSNTLGLEVRHRAEGYAELAVNGPKFALLERWRVPALVGNAEALRPPAGAHEAELAFLVDDVDAVYGTLRARDVVFVCAPHRPTLEPADGVLQRIPTTISSKSLRTSSVPKANQSLT